MNYHTESENYSKTILIADDHPIVRQGLVNLIKENRVFEILAECRTGNEALEKIKNLKPDIALLDISMPGMNGLDVIEQSVKEGVETDFVILTMFHDEEYFEMAMELGVKGYMLKENALSELQNCLNTVISGDFYICPALSKYMIRKDKKVTERTIPLEKLTPAEKKVLKEISLNKTSPEIADKLFISTRTVQNHRHNICKKLALRGPNALLEFALKNRGVL